MILEVSENESKYGKYFLAFEAPNSKKKKWNMKVVTVKPNRRARLDFTNDIVVDDMDALPDVEPDDTLDDFNPDDLPEVMDDNEDMTLDDVPGMDALPDVEPDDLPEVDGVGDDFNATMDLPDVDNQTPEVDGNDFPEVDTEDDLPPVDNTGGDDLPEVAPDQNAPNVDAELPDVAPDDTLPEVDDPEMDMDLPDIEPEDPNLPDVDDDPAGNNVTVQPSNGNTEGDYANGEGQAPDPNDPNANPGGNDPNAVEDFTVDPYPEDNQNAGGDPNADLNAGETEDFTNPDGGGADPNATGDPNADPNAGAGTDKGPGLEYDSMRKYILYKEYGRLRISIETYINKLEGTISDDPDANQIIKTATGKLREVHDMLTDYMLMKFEISNYVQNQLFFQRMVVIVQLIFKLLKTANGLYTKGTENRKKNS